jgi:prophage DNA circulation protein
MSLQDLQKASYRSPSGITVEFDYEDIEVRVEKKVSVFENAVGNGTYIQSNGHTSGRYPMRAYFHGFGFEYEAETFLRALLEDGEGVLTHPVWDYVNVVPVGEIRRVDPLKSGAGQVIYEVEFFETTGLQIGETGGLEQAFDDLENAGAMDFTDGVFLGDAPSKSSFRNNVESTIKKMSVSMAPASGAIAQTQEGIEDTVDSIHRGMDSLLGDPLSLARQIQILIGEPRRSDELSRSKTLAYTNLAWDIFNGSLAESRTYTQESINLFHLNYMIAKSLIGNIAMTMEKSSEYLTKADFVDAATSLMDLSDAYQIWRDDNFDAIEQAEISRQHMDVGGGGSEMQHLVSMVASSLFARALRAKSEIREPLRSDRTPLDLCFEYYGTTAFSVLDRFIVTNQLAGDEIILIPRGRSIVRYV